MPAHHDPESIRKQYETDELLRIRQETHDLYTVPKINFVEWALKCIHWQGSERVLDVGCGPGTYYSALQAVHPDIDYHGLDASEGMLIKHPAPDENLKLGQADDLPFDDDSFDVVMANHMLYHVPNIEKAIVEFKRVLKPGGIIMTATNSLHNMPEFQVLMRRAVVLLTRLGASQVRAPAPASDAFALENGARILARHFYGVVRYDLPGSLVFTEVDPAIRYLDSTRNMREPQLPDDVMWEDVILIMRQQITHLVNHFGELSITKIPGVLLASDNGGFIREFVEHKERANSHEGDTSDDSG